MNYKKWNDCIASYLFNGKKRNEEVFLYLTRDDIIQIYKRDNGLDDKSDDLIWEDFIIAINNPSFNNFRATSEASFIERLHSLYNYSKLRMFRDDFKYPIYIGYLIFLVLPLTEMEGVDMKINENNYYGRAKRFFKDNNVVFNDNNSDLSTNGLKKLCIQDRDSGYFDLWADLECWSIKYGNGRFTKPVIRNNNKNRYVRSIWTQSILTANERARFKTLFSRLDIPPYVDWSDVQIEAFVEDEAGKYIYNNRLYRWNYVKDNYRDILISAFRQEYSKWDGRSYVGMKTKEKDSYIIQDNGTTYNLFLSFVFNEKERRLDFGYEVWYKNSAESPDKINFSWKEKKYPIFLKSDGWGNNSIKIENIPEILKNGDNVMLKDKENGIRAISHTSRFYLFQKLYGNKWVSKSIYEQGKKYYLLISNDRINIEPNLEQWLNNYTQKITGYTLPENYLLYKIEKAISYFEQIRTLTFPSEISINDIHNIIIKRNAEETVFSDLFPSHFEILGVDIPKVDIYAQFIKSSDIIPLSYDEGNNLWSIDIVNLKSSSYINSLFKIHIVNKSSGAEIFTSFKSYSFTHHQLPNSYSDSYRNRLGEHCNSDDDILCNGLKVFKSKAQGHDLFALKSEPFNPDGCIYERNDYILYAITSLVLIGKNDFYDILDSVEFNNKIVQNCYRSNLLNEYDRLGFINYDYFNKSHLITINRPTLVLLPQSYRETNNPGTHGVEREDSFYSAIFIGARTIDLVMSLEKYADDYSIKIRYKSQESLLLPQQIVLYTKELTNFIKIAEKIGCDYTNKVYSADLFCQLKSVNDYISETLINENITNKYPADCSRYGSFSCIDYKTLKKKPSYNVDLDLVTYNPRTMNEHSILWINNKQYVVDKYWGHFVVMSKLKIKQIIYDSERKLIKVPLTLRLPKMYARVCSLISDKRPFIENGYNCYYITYSPYTTNINPKNILEKLNQL